MKWDETQTKKRKKEKVLLILNLTDSLNKEIKTKLANTSQTVYASHEINKQHWQWASKKDVLCVCRLPKFKQNFVILKATSLALYYNSYANEQRLRKLHKEI